MAETREAQVARWEREGHLVRACFGCQEFYEAVDRRPCEVFAPSHKAADRCESGKRPHCTCDVCF